MKKFLLFSAFIFLVNIFASAQVTRINNNGSLSPEVLLNPNLAIVISGIDQTLWVTDGTVDGTFQLTDTIKSTGTGTLLNGKYIFGGSTVAAGVEIFITDGTKSGTKLVKDIYPGSTGSDPDGNMAVLNGFVYFTATTAAEGRELWRTDGTSANTTLVKDIVPGPAGSIGADSSELTATDTYLLFDVRTAAEGRELWRSDGTSAGTFLLKDINAGVLSSNPNNIIFYKNNLVYFLATDAAHGEEIWTTDGTAAGTNLLKDINPGPDSSTFIPIQFAPGFKFESPVFDGFHLFNNHLFFMANDGVHGSAVWVTDGTTNNTSLLKVLSTDTVLNSFFVLDAINLPGKFIFPFSNLKDRYELWQSDGTPSGTVLFKSYPINTNKNFPYIYLNYSIDLVARTITYPLFNGIFFFSASGAEGNELWMSDGTPANTKIVKDINPGTADAIKNVSSYIYTKQGFYFAANDGTHGNELWKTNGTDTGTSIVQDIYPGTGNADPQLSFIVKNKILFTATDGDDPNHTDLFVVGGTFTALPVQLLDFSVVPKGNDALLQWSTSQEINSKNFVVQSSDDAQYWNNIGTVAAAGNSSVKIDYSFTDINVMNSSKNIVYYQLITTDINGKAQNSNVISLKIKSSAKWNVQLFSNPIHGDVKALLSGIKGLAEISIYDLNEKTIYKKQIQNQNGLISIPVNLASGAYILVVKTNNERKTIQFIKE
jgi:ELWxxDGT repeat protein